jgi:large-conductance mechanosensitive channel
MEANFLADFVSSGMLLDMTIGMILGMAASPLMMKGIKAIRQRRKINRLFREIANARENAKLSSVADNNSLSISDQ